jgi:hypothetical protein
MKILQVPQGYYGDLSGMSALDAFAMFTLDDMIFQRRNPKAVPFHRPWWHELEVKDGDSAPWGFVWYRTDDDGKLQMHSASYDSSG